MSRLLVIASSPHIRSETSTAKIMGWALIALAPAGLAGIWFLGARSVLVMAVCVASCVAAEAVWQKGSKRKITVSDLSAAVTGLLLAYSVPPTIPLWTAACGSVFAMVVVKHFFGGLGQNIVNPALAARAMMLICWPVAMTAWTVHGISGPTPLSILGSGVEETGGATALPSLMDAFLGNMGGCIGETSVLALLIGGGILIFKEIISWRVPVTYIATVAVMSEIFGRGGPLLEIMTGGLMLGAIFMATDYTTSPMTPKGQFVFALGCGLLTALIRTFGGYPEGVSYSILIMNLTVPIIDRMTAPRVFGGVGRLKEAKKHGGK
ncbi:MAG: RnfABCDGE type electron transport complex subunit D [Synergistaceae bacterium]|jgi:electron transport complex protein RnfD|nr:RnfABCDGE type electron transport complex subunit D [Synergistaceae bacterium]